MALKSLDTVSDANLGRYLNSWHYWTTFNCNPYWESFNTDGLKKKLDNEFKGLIDIT